LALESKIKQAVLFYDEIYFEDGTYEFIVWGNGSFEMNYPPGSVDEEFRNFESQQISGQKGYVGIRGPNSTITQAIMGGEILNYYRADYYRLLRKIGPEIPDFIKTYLPRLDQKTKSGINRETWRDMRHPRIKEMFGSNNYLRDKVVRNLNTDLIISASVSTPIVVDALHLPVLSEKFLKLRKSLKARASKVDFALDSIIRFYVPDFSSKSWDEILELRSDPAIVEFRKKIVEASELIRDEREIILHPLELQIEIGRFITQEILKEMESLHAKGSKVLVNLGLGLVSLAPPPSGTVATLLSMGKEGLAYLKGAKAWYVILMKLLN